MLGDGDDVAAQDESGGEDEYGGYAPLGAGDDDNIDDAQQAAAAVQGLEGLEVHAQMARIGVALYVSEEEQQRRRAEAMAAFDARYQEEVQVAAAAAATNERFPAFSADHINDIKEAMRGISLPVDAPAWAQGGGNKKGGKEKGGGGTAGGAVRHQQLLAKLPLALPTDHLTRDMSGPTPYSNWVVRGCLLVGAYPLKPYMTEAILKQGTRPLHWVTVFVCLMEESEFGKHGKHYFDVAKSMLDSRPSDFVQKSQELRYVHHPIPDRMIGSDDATLVLVEKILAFLRAGEMVYIHCYGGHGRTGIFASVLLGRIHGIDAEKALQLCKLYHDCRPDVEGISAKSVPSPQTHDQRAQVVRLLR
ncbi:uncharacterized protein ACA1_183190 [Acanthamoeba castellanii str. Neff]|uniref:Tyrosine specific protein phosphatases domain-containing protein n=1 Tax=Acanthamoeba castellanii (strain ATCC 30010 / Neff) TaxID=1257118 RepID=L8H893_ACACF|nr:uncharacterized protein ACA1_183190 [Acanthamoeba castellanii str. Neff]ELR21385.1 hypothetical protein ACA1_183190 [Acanthamoeba castellanii str. Neff]